MPRRGDLLERLEDCFNARDTEAVPATMHRDVVWANGLDDVDTMASAITGRDNG